MEQLASINVVRQEIQAQQDVLRTRKRLSVLSPLSTLLWSAQCGRKQLRCTRALRRWHQLDHAIIRTRYLRSLRQFRSMYAALWLHSRLVPRKLQTTSKMFHKTRPKFILYGDVSSMRDCRCNKHFVTATWSK